MIRIELTTTRGLHEAHNFTDVPAAIGYLAATPHTQRNVWYNEAKIEEKVIASLVQREKWRRSQTPQL